MWCAPVQVKLLAAPADAALAYTAKKGAQDEYMMSLAKVPAQHDCQLAALIACFGVHASFQRRGQPTLVKLQSTTVCRRQRH